MLSSTICIMLAAALLSAPPPASVHRLAGLWPVPRSAHPVRPWVAGPAALGGLVGLLLAGPGGAFAGAAVVEAMRRRSLRRRAADLTATTADQLADAVGRITDELRSGSQPATALEGVVGDGPRAAELLAPAAVAARLGDGIPAALRRTAAEHGTVGADLRRLAAAWALSERHGIPLAEVLAGVQGDLRWRARFGSSVLAELAGPRATATVLTGLPVLGLGLGQLLGADPLGVLRSGMTGQGMLVLGVGLSMAGNAWTERILGKAVPR